MKTAYLILAFVAGFMFGSVVLASEFSVTLGAGWNGNISGSSIPWENGGGVGFYGQLAYEHELSDQSVLLTHWTHLSQIDVGPPWNDRDESSVDHLGVAIKWTF